MSANLITPENCPRDLGGLVALTRIVRYRLALSLSLFPDGSAQEQAFISADDTTQSQALLTALQARDAGELPGNGHQMPAPYVPQVIVPSAVIQTPINGAGQQPLAVAPAPYGGPSNQPMYPTGPAYGNQPQQHVPQSAPPPPPHGGYVPQQQQQQQQGYQPPQQAPQPHTQFSPTPRAPQQQHFAPPPMTSPMAHPSQAPQQAPQQVPIAAVPNLQTQPPAIMRQPSTYGDPANTGKQVQQINNPVLTSAEVARYDELKKTVLGIARTQNMLMNLVLELASSQLGVTKPILAKMLVGYAQAGEPEKFFDVGSLQGKAQ